MRLVEVVPGGDLVIEQRHVLVQRLLVHVLLVEGPAELVERELVVLGAGADRGDRRVGLLGVEVLLAREEVLAAPELHLVDVLRVRIRGDQALHHRDRLVGAPELVVRARLLVEHLIVVRVVGVGREDLVVERDRLERTRRRSGRLLRAGQLERDAPSRGRARGRAGRAPLERLLGLAGLRAGRRCGVFARRVRRRHALGLRRRQLDDLAVAEDPVLLLELQVGEAPHRLGRQRGLGRLLEELPVAVHGLVEAVLDPHLRHVGLHVVQLAQRVAIRKARAGRDSERGRRSRAVRARHIGARVLT